jgi:hypothetical protein
MLALAESVNTFHLEFSDLAGNTVHNWQNVTLDTVGPSITLTSAPTTVSAQSYNLRGTVDPGTRLYVNGYGVDVVSTRQTAAAFNTTVKLSPGSNTIVIEARDSVGNVEVLRHVVFYDTTVDTSGDSGRTEVNYAAIGLMAALLFVGLILGLIIGPMIFGGKKEELPEEEIEPLPEEELPPEDEGIEPLPEDEPAPEGDVDIESAEAVEDIEPIPAEESIPEELPEELPEEPAPEEPAETEELPAEPEAAPVEEDPRIAKLTQAYESGKISKELYEKNLAKFKGE